MIIDMLSDTRKKPGFPQKFFCKSERFENQQLNYNCGVQYSNSSFLIVYKCSLTQLAIFSVLKQVGLALRVVFSQFMFLFLVVLNKVIKIIF